MIPVTQTKTVIRNKDGQMIVRGNCYASCIASILEVPITEVPNVEVLYDHESFWLEVMLTFLNIKGWELCSVDDVFAIDLELKNYKQDQFYLVGGMSCRGVNHMVIYQNGKMVHDPYPTKEGLIRIHEIQTLEKI
jgi:hypothetical protein